MRPGRDYSILSRFFFHGAFWHNGGAVSGTFGLSPVFQLAPRAFGQRFLTPSIANRRTQEPTHVTSRHAVHRPVGRSAAGRHGPQGQRLRLPGPRAGLLGRPLRGRTRPLADAGYCAGQARPARTATTCSATPSARTWSARPCCDRIDAAAQGDPAAARVGRRQAGRRQRARRRGAEEHGPRRAEARRRRRQRLHRLEHLAPAVFVPAGAASR